MSQKVLQLFPFRLIISLCHLVLSSPRKARANFLNNSTRSIVFGARSFVRCSRLSKSSSSGRFPRCEKFANAQGNKRNDSKFFSRNAGQKISSTAADMIDRFDESRLPSRKGFLCGVVISTRTSETAAIGTNETSKSSDKLRVEIFGGSI